MESKILIASPADQIFTEHQAADYLGLKPNTLNRWRMTNTGPVYSRIGNGRGTIRYRKSGLDKWMDENERRAA